MDIQRISAFSDGDAGGNPAGVVLCERTLPPVADMQRVAAEVGYSETAFAAPEGDAWQVRYFSPAAEVPFCGHATIALGAALARAHGDGTYALKLARADITVEGRREGGRHAAALQSPATRSAPAEAARPPVGQMRGDRAGLEPGVDPVEQLVESRCEQPREQRRPPAETPPTGEEM